MKTKFTLFGLAASLALFTGCVSHHHKASADITTDSFNYRLDGTLSNRTHTVAHYQTKTGGIANWSDTDILDAIDNETNGPLEQQISFGSVHTDISTNAAPLATSTGAAGGNVIGAAGSVIIDSQTGGAGKVAIPAATQAINTLVDQRLSKLNEETNSAVGIK